MKIGNYQYEKTHVIFAAAGAIAGLVVGVAMKKSTTQIIAISIGIALASTGASLIYKKPKRI